MYQFIEGVKRSRSKKWISLMVLWLVYLVSAKIGLHFAFVNASITALWPPSGIALASFFLLGSWVWPAIFLGAISVNWVSGLPVITAIGIGIGNTLCGFIGAKLLQRKKEFQPELSNANDVLIFGLYGVVIGPMISASVGVTSLCLGGRLSTSNLGEAWVSWWTGDATGILVTVPLLFVLATNRWQKPSALRLFEAVVLVAVFTGTVFFIFDTQRLFLFLFFPFIIYAALRFRQLGVTTLISILAAISIPLTILGHGPLMRMQVVPLSYVVFVLHVFIWTTSVTGLLLGASITSLMRVDLIMKQSDELLNSQRIARLGSWRLNLANGEIFWTEELYHMWGFDPKLPPPDYTESNMLRLFTPEGWRRVNEAVTRTQTTGQPYEIELEMLRNDGTNGWMHAYGEAVRDESGRIIGLRGVAQDITERKSLEIDLLVAKNAAENALKSKAKFLDIAAHELRTPVTAISLILQFVQKQIEKGQSINSDLLSKLRDPVDRLSHLVVDLLDVSRLERGLLIMRKERTDMVNLISKCLEEFRLQSPKRMFHFQIPEGPIEANVDSIRINQVLSNLIDNAVKYTPDESAIDVRIDVLPKSVRITVTDQGIGISEEEQRHLFTAFVRGTSEATVRAGGLGLGLSVCRGIIELHGGTIGFTSKEGEGSTFYFELPLDSASVT